MRLIDADALKEVLHGTIDWLDLIGVDKAINDAPTIDAEPVVRCKECIHCADDWNGNQPMFTCELGRCGESVMPNDFCSYGERRDNEID